MSALLQRVLAPGADARIAAWLARAVATVPAGGLVLDVGCGERPRLVAPGARTVAVDIDASRLPAARRHGALAVRASADALPFRDRSLAASATVGMLHHLPDAAAARALAELARVTTMGGPVIVFDAVVPEPAWRRPVAWTLRRLDRGRWMRRERHLHHLLPRDQCWQARRVHYAATGLEALLAHAHRT